MSDNLAILKNIVLFEDFKEDEKVLRKIDQLFTEREAQKCLMPHINREAFHPDNIR